MILIALNLAIVVAIMAATLGVAYSALSYVERVSQEKKMLSVAKTAAECSRISALADYDVAAVRRRQLALQAAVDEVEADLASGR
jgi:hypothetical protein